MTTYNTGNPIGSTDARDRSDNSENLDLAVNSLSQTFVDRFGVVRDTLEGIYQKSAYYRAGTFAAGYTLTNNRQTLAYGNVEYSWSGAFPKVVPAGSTPSTAGGVGVGAWSDKTDLTLRSEISAIDGAGLIGSMSYTQLRAYSGSQTTVNIWGISNVFDGAAGTFKVTVSDTTSLDNSGTILVDSLGRRWYRQYYGNISAKWFGVVGDGTTDDTSSFISAITCSKSANKILDISNSKIYLGSQSSSINLDGCKIVGNGKLPKPQQDTAYLNGADHAVSIWTSLLTYQGSGIFSRYNGAIFTGKTFPVSGVTILGDYTQASSSAFVQTIPTAYPNWSQALTDTAVDVFYFGSDGIKLLGGLEVSTIRNINIYFCGSFCLNVQGNTSGVTNAVNAPIEYLDFDDTCSFVGGKLGNVWFNGFRKFVTFSGCMLNSAGLYDVQKAANPSFTITGQDVITSPIRVTSLAAGVYGGVNHVTSTQLKVERCYAEVAQSLVLFDGYPINYVEFENNTLYPWDNSLPKNLLSFYSNVYRLRTKGNQSIDGVFYLNIGAAYTGSAVDYVIGERTNLGSFSFVGSSPLESAITPVTYNQQSGSIGNGTAATFTYSVAINEQVPLDTGTATAIWAVTANFQSSGNDNFETVLIAVTRMSSGNYVGQILVGKATSNVFTSNPSVTTAGVLQIPLALYARARVTRLDTQPLKIWQPTHHHRQAIY